MVLGDIRANFLQNWTTLAVALGATFIAQAARSETPTLRLSGEFRTRIEGISNQARAGVRPDETLLNLRTALNLGVGNGPFQLGGSLVDSRVYTAKPGTGASNNEVNAIEPVRAFASYDIADPFGPGSKMHLLAGRFTMDVGSRRLIANDDYRNTTSSFTGVKVDLAARHGWSGTAFYTLPQIRRPEESASVIRNVARLDREGLDFRLFGMNLARALPDRHLAADVGIYRLDERDIAHRATRNRHLTTLSARLFRAPAPGNAHFEAEYIHQGGSVRSALAPGAARLNVEAWFAHASLGYTWPVRWEPRLTLEYDHASGDGPGASYGRFDSLFGMRRADLGPGGIYFAIGRTNIITPAVRLEVTPTKRLDGFVAWRELWLAAARDAFSSTNVRDATGAAGRHAGSEIDARLRWWAIPGHLRLEADTTFLLKGSFYSRAPNSPGRADTRYWSLNATTMF